MLLSVGLATLCAAPQKPMTIKLGQQLEIGRKEMLFGSIASICEDEQSNFYVLDRQGDKNL